MVRVLIALRGTIAGHQWARTGHTVLLVALLVGLASAGSTFALGFAQHARPDVGGDVLAVVFVLWTGGHVAQAALGGGDATLRPELFALLPVPTRRLAWSLLVLRVLDPATGLLFVAYAALIPLGAHSGPGAALLGLVAAVLSTGLTVALSTIAGGVLGPGSRRGHDVGTLLTATALSLLALTGTLLPAAISALDGGHAHALTRTARALPSGWGVDAVGAARDQRMLTAVGWLAALAALTLVCALVWPRVLRRRMAGATGRRRARGRTPRPRGIRLPATPTGAVCAKELRLWARDPVRLTCLVIAAVVGLGVALVPRLTAGSTLLMPFGGPLSIVIAGACACNLYGNDGTSLWLTVMTPDSAASDVRGRQAAWALVVAPFAMIETVVLTATSGRHDLWPWALALTIALLGGAAGLLPVASLHAVQPLDEAGNPTPGWSIKVHVALYATAATAVPAAAVLAYGVAVGSSAISWAAVAVATTTAFVLTRWGRRRAVRRLPAVETELLAVLATSAR